MGDGLSSPEKVCRSSIAPPQSKCSIQRGTDVAGKHINDKKNQEHMQGVNWDPRHLRWLVHWRSRDENGKVKNAQGSFSRHQFMRPGLTAEEADQEARRQACAFRQTLVNKGAIRLYRASGMKHIQWSARTNSWHVGWLEDGKRRQRSFAVEYHMHAGMSNEEAKETALWKAAAFRATVLGNTRPKRKRPKCETT